MNRTDGPLVRHPTTLIVLYYRPDHPWLLQEFLWQTLDLPPTFPRVQRFMAYWRKEIHATVHSASVSVGGVVRPFEFRAVRFSGTC